MKSSIECNSKLESSTCNSTSTSSGKEKSSYGDSLEKGKKYIDDVHSALSGKHVHGNNCGHMGIFHKTGDGASHIGSICDGKMQCFTSEELSSEDDLCLNSTARALRYVKTEGDLNFMVVHRRKPDGSCCDDVLSRSSSTSSDGLGAERLDVKNMDELEDKVQHSLLSKKLRDDLKECDAKKSHLERM